MDNAIFWDINKTLSYNALFNFVIGNRGGGKSYGFKEWAFKSFLKTGKEFIYVRRFKQELKNIDTYWNDLAPNYPEHDFEAKNGEFFIDKKYCGRSIPLSTAKIEKSTAFPNVDKICFDEFILDKGVHHYLPDEVTNFLELYETIARMRDVRVFFLSNAITITNPYFIYFDINLPYGKSISRTDDILIELVAKQDYIEEKKKTRFARLIEGTNYARYSIENTFLRDSKTFVAKKPMEAVYYFSFVFNDVMYGVWVDWKEALMYVSVDVDESNKRVFSLQTSDHRPNMVLLKGTKKGALPLHRFLDFYKFGCVRFESVKVKNICDQVIKMCL